jgi:hypothetical protein
MASSKEGQCTVCCQNNEGYCDAVPTCCSGMHGDDPSAHRANGVFFSHKPSQIPLVNGRNTRTFGILNLAPRPYHEQADDIKIMVTLPRLPWHGSLCLTR